MGDKKIVQLIFKRGWNDVEIRKDKIIYYSSMTYNQFKIVQKQDLMFCSVSAIGYNWFTRNSETILD